ncbi:MAG: antibiotic biosynthesis monooxygenase [Pseudomonadota bacterium]|nr:antibiotic biosynthesis monooxygenase [Pseudomonadota bacterium]
MSGLTSGFAAIYQWRVKPGMEAQFVEAWTAVTRQLMRIDGARGSRLHRLENGNFVAYAQWPDRATWEVACTQETIDIALSQRMLDTTEDVWPPMLLTTVIDLLMPEGQVVAQFDAITH